MKQEKKDEKPLLQPPAKIRVDGDANQYQSTHSLGHFGDLFPHSREVKQMDLYFYPHFPFMPSKSPNIYSSLFYVYIYI